MNETLISKVREAMGSCSYGYIQEIIQSIEFSHGELTKDEVEEVERTVEKAIDCIIEAALNRAVFFAEMKCAPQSIFMSANFYFVTHCNELQNIIRFFPRFNLK